MTKEVVLAKAEGRTVGYLRLEYLWSRIAYIGLIKVKEKLRDKGIGRARLRFLENYLSRKGHRRLTNATLA